MKLYIDTAHIAWSKLKPMNKSGRKNIPPKQYLIEDHLLWFFKDYFGCGELNEQFVERFPQYGKHDHLRARSIQKLIDKYTAMSR